MSYLSLTNLFTRSHNPFLPEAPSKNLLLNDNNKTTKLNENNNQIQTTNENDNKIIKEVWSKHNFQTTKNNKINIELIQQINNTKMSWATTTTPPPTTTTNNNNSNKKLIINNNQMKKLNENNIDVINDNHNKIEEMEITTTSSTNYEKDEQPSSPSHHARRPMNAFLIFCKKHRPIVRQKFPTLENRGVTRILGEWWALLDETEKSPYTNLAKEHKDAFLLANPDFKWYKLPAPPLRSLNTRPTSVHNKIPSPISSPTLSSLMESEFTPGKLADESQLGSLTSLMNNNFSPTTTTTTTLIKLPDDDKINDAKSNENNNNVEEEKLQQYGEKKKKAYCNNLLISPVNLIKTTLPPKPIKKRIFSQYLDNKNVARNLLLNDLSAVEENNKKQSMMMMNDEQRNHDDVDDDGGGGGNKMKEDSNNMTNQDLMNKVVDSIYMKQNDDVIDYNNQRILRHHTKEIRKSGRQCKGKRYEKFMVECKLLGNKRDTKLTSQKFSDVDKIENELNYKLLETTKSSDINETPKLDLDYTIKRLAERTNLKLYYENQKNEDCIINNDDVDEKLLLNERVTNNNNNNSISDNINTDNNNKNNNNSTQQNSNNFNLDLRINNLPSLSYDIFSQRKKESKKRKSRTKIDNELRTNKISKFINNNKNDIQLLVGSKKRKNKQSITHLGKKFDDTTTNNLNNDLLGLATLAEVAANTQKIHETKISLL